MTVHRDARRSQVPANSLPIGSPAESTWDPITLGRRIRHRRGELGLTLDALAQQVGTAASQLSLVENGRREPRLSLLQSIASVLQVPLADLLRTDPPSRRAALEIALEHAQRAPLYSALGVPPVKAGPRLPLDALESLVGMHRELERRATEQVATPEEARRANAELRRRMREQDNYFPDIEQAAAELLRGVGHESGPLSQRVLSQLAGYLGFTIHLTSDLPHAARSVVDLRHHRIYLPAQIGGGHDPRAIALQAMGHVVLGHQRPASYADFLRQRVEVNYFAAALLVPEQGAMALLRQAKAVREVDIEDLRDAFAVSYETAAHRFTNLATRGLGIPVHFMRVHESGTIYKAYENDGVIFPHDVTGAIEGQHVCRNWTARTVFGVPNLSGAYSQYTDTPAGTYWCTAMTDSTSAGAFSVSVGVPYAHVKWFRGRETQERSTSRCPDERCCRRPPAALQDRWQDNAWPSALAHSHLLAALPPGSFPGVDDTEVYTFLEAHAPAAG